VRDAIRDYLTTVQAALNAVDHAEIERVVDVLYRAYRAGNRVYTFGNGASAALASHMACDLGKGTATDLGQGSADSGVARLKIVSLVDNGPLISAYGNDICYDAIFVEQLKNLLERGDIAIGISGSGGSPNVLHALQYARERGAMTIGFTGHQPKSARMIALCDLVLRAPLTMMEQIEDVHVVFHHAISVSLRRRIAVDPLLVRPLAGHVPLLHEAGLGAANGAVPAK
jgi:D-sedoheptulose 7-phosphate isomerase